MCCQCCSINKLTLVVKVVFHVTEIIIVQLGLKHVWKKDGFLYKTATYFTRWRVVYGMETRYRDIVSIHRFTTTTKKSRGKKLLLSLPQNIHEYVQYMVIMVISWTDSLQVIMDKLDEIYFMAYMVFMPLKSNNVNLDWSLNSYQLWNVIHRVNVELTLVSLESLYLSPVLLYYKKYSKIRNYLWLLIEITITIWVMILFEFLWWSIVIY